MTSTKVQMMFDWRQFAYNGLGFIVAVFFLWLANSPRSHRYQQRWYPPIVLLLGALAIWFYIYPHAYIESLLNEAFTWQSSVIGLYNSSSPDSFPLFFNLIFILIFLSIKAGLRLLQKIIGWSIMLFSWLSKVILKRTRKQKAPTNLFPAYEDDKDRGITLCHKWIYPSQYMLWMACFSSLFIVASMAYEFSNQSSLSVYLSLLSTKLPSISFLLFLETYWYLHGYRPSEKRGLISGEDAVFATKGAFEKLWKKYIELWQDRIIVAKSGLNNKFESTSIAPPMEKHHGTNSNFDDINLVERSLGKLGITLSAQQRNILEDAWNGKDLTLIESVYTEISPVLFPVIQRDILEGHHILILAPDKYVIGSDNKSKEEITCWVRRWLDLPCFTKVHYKLRVCEYPSADVVITSIEQILQHAFVEHKSWFNDLKCVIIVNVGETIFPNINSAMVLFHSLADLRGKPPQYFFLCVEDRKNLESSLRDSLGVHPQEYKIPSYFPEECRYICFKNEGKAIFQTPVINSARALGYELPLAIPAARDGIFKINLFDAQKTAWEEAREEIDKQENDISLQNIVLNSTMPSLHNLEDRSFSIVFDSHNNLAYSLNNSFKLAKKAALSLVVSKPYMFRDYFADDIDYFLHTNAKLSSFLAPTLLADKNIIAHSLLQRLLLTPVSHDAIEWQTKDIGLSSEAGIEEKLEELFRDVFGVEILQKSFLTSFSKYNYDRNTNAFQKLDSYSLRDSIKEHITNILDQYIYLIDPGGKKLSSILADHVYQHYLPRQVHAFGGKAYTIKTIDVENARIELEHTNDPATDNYEPCHMIDLTNINPIQTPVDQGRAKGKISIRRELCEASYSIETKGYYTFQHEGSTHPEYTPLEQCDSDPIKHTYRRGRVMRFTITMNPPTKGFVIDDDNKVASTLALLINESITTIFPETSRLLLVTCKSALGRNNSSDARTFNSPMNLLPVLKGDGLEKSVGNEIVLYFFENSTLDMGLAKAVYNEWITIFSLLEDYLVWLKAMMDQGDDPGYLGYGGDTIHPDLDIDGCLSLLELLLSEDAHRLRIKRSAKRDHTPTDEISERRACDFCGESISGSVYKQHADGREQCVNCNRTAVIGRDELRNIYEEARVWMIQKYKIDIRRSVEVQFTNAKEIAKELGREFEGTKEFDPRAVGFARRDKGQIYIENGQPYHMAIGTIVHELTHIWQFDNIQMEKAGLLYIEGHAQWVQLDYLKEFGLGVKYSQQERERGDVYGEGFREIDKLVKASDSQDPFVIIKNLFPI